MDIVPGTMFDTPFEKKCVARTEPDECGDFIGIDSEGVECRFHTDMVENVYES